MTGQTLQPPKRPDISHLPQHVQVGILLLEAVAAGTVLVTTAGQQ